MTKVEFIKFIKELGFTEAYQSDGSGPLNFFSMTTDVVDQPNYNHMSFRNELKISLDDDRELVQLSLSKMSNHMMSGKSFGNFSLRTFGDKDDFQLEIFLSFILNSFNEKPKSILQLMRDKKIENILK